MANTVVQPPIADVASITDPVYAYKSDNGFFSAEFAQTIGTDDAVKFTTNGYSFAWKPQNVIYVDDAGNMDVVFGVNGASTAQVYKSRVSYVGTSQITTDIFDCENNQLKHTIQMVAPPRIPAGYIGTPAQMASGGVITYDPSLQVFADGQVQTTDFTVMGNIGFKDASGVLIYKLPMITVEDANGQTTQGTYKVTFNADGTISFYGMVPWNWLQTAAYPVIIDPTVIVSSAYDISGNGGRKMVRLSNGWIVTAAYASSTIYWFVSKDNGQTWAVLTQFVLASAVSGLYIAICSIGTIVYTIFPGSTTSVSSTAFDATIVGSTITANTAINGGLTSISTGFAIESDGSGGLQASYVAKDGAYPNSLNVKYSKATVSGTTMTWVTPTLITTNNTSGIDSVNTCIVINSSNNAVIFYQFPSSSTYYIEVARWTGSAWSYSTVYSVSSRSQQNPCGAVDGNDAVYCGWDGSDATYSTTNRARWSKSTDGGVTWSAMALINPSSTRASTNVSFTIRPDNSVDAFWQEIDPAISATYTQIRRANLPAGSSTWGVPVTVTNNTTAHATNAQTLWSKFNMNSADAVRYMWMTGSAVDYDYIQLNNPPLAPTLTAHANFDATVAQTLAWLFNDPDGGNTQSAYQLQLYDTTNLTTPVIDTGKVGSTVSSYSLVANALTNGKNYQWRVQTWDQSGAQGPYSGYSTFSTSAPPVATIATPTSGATITSNNYTFAGGYTQPQGVAEQSFQFKLWDSTGTNVLQDSGTIIGTSNAKTFSGLSNSTSYEIEFIATSQSGVSASSGKIPFSVAYTPPATPTATTSNDAPNDRVVVTFTNPTPSGSQPTVSSNSVYRRKTGDTIWKLVQQGVSTSPFYDYTCPLGSYDYGVVGVSSAGATSGYGMSTVTSSFVGEQLIDESNPANNVTFLYNQRESDATVNQKNELVETFAKFPRIRKGQARYATGNLTALYLDKDGDVNAQVDKVDAMCNSDSTYLLKSVNGRVYRVSLSQLKHVGKYGNSQSDVSVVWTEVGDV